VRARRISLLLAAWLAFDLATPLPGAFEFEIQDSEIEHSLQAGREAQALTAPASTRPRGVEGAEADRTSRTPSTPAPAIDRATGDRWVRQVRLAHRPSAGRVASLEDH
jgi:hypothetical protein